MSRKFLPLLLSAALILSACSLRLRVPVAQTPGPLVTDHIAVPLPAGDKPARLNLVFGVGTLRLAPGAANLVTGTAAYNIPDFKPEVKTSSSTVRIEQGNYRLTGIPDLANVENEWDFQLGNVPLDLEIEAGAYKGELSLGGLALLNLTIKDGASEVTLSFDKPNPVKMNLLRYETGASNITMTGLANANFAAMELASGAGNYTLDFSGELKNDASVTIETGVSNLTLIIPQEIPAQITVQGALANVSHSAGWTQAGNVYTQAGSGPMLVIVIEIGAGNLTLTR